jgi:hypothetical protein
VSGRQDAGNRGNLRKDGRAAGALYHTSHPSHPQSSGEKGRTGHLSTTQLNHVEMQDCLSWWEVQSEHQYGNGVSIVPNVCL